MSRSISVTLTCFFLFAQLHFAAPTARLQKRALKAGVAAVKITPFGPDRDWDGSITDSGVWGENFTDTNHNGRWDSGEPFEDDPGNDSLDPSSKGKYDGVFLAGFGNNRLATGKHDDLWARALVLESGSTKIAIVSIDFIGYYSKANYYGLGEINRLVIPSSASARSCLQAPTTTKLRIPSGRGDPAHLPTGSTPST